MKTAPSYTPGYSGPRESMALRSLEERARAWQAPAALSAAIRELRADADLSLAERRPGPARGVSPEQRLIQRLSLGWNMAEQQLIGQLGYEAYLERQLDYEAIDDSFLEQLLAEAFPTLSMSPAQILQGYIGDPSVPVVELLLATLFRSLYSPRLLFERMAIFWSDHFNIDLFGGLGFLLKPTDDREVVRRYALGSFPELLWASAHSPAMLSYLTNDTNDKDHPNENYARELMELHTMGADRGYTEQDVKEVARCFTGWRFFGPAAGPAFGHFYFDADRHDTGEKLVLGQVIPAGGGRDDGEMVLAILAGRPETADFIARKLLVYMWGYEPPTGLVDEVATAYRQTGGDIRAMLRVALAKARLGDAPPKLKRPYHLMVSSLRALFAEVTDPGLLFEFLQEAGHLPFAWAPPNGYPDSLGYWSGLVLPRWNFAASVVLQGISGLEEDQSTGNRSRGVTSVVQRIDQILLNGTMSLATRKAIAGFLLKGPPTETRVQDAFGLVIGSPEFQSY